MAHAEDLVFGVGYKLDAEGKIIERGFGNLADRVKQSVAAVVAAAPPEPAVASSASVTVAAAASAAPVIEPAPIVEPAQAPIAASAEPAPIVEPVQAPVEPPVGIVAHLKELLAEAEKTITDL